MCKRCCHQLRYGSLTQARQSQGTSFTCPSCLAVKLAQAVIRGDQIAAPGTTLTGWTLQLVNTPAAIPITTVDESRFVQFGVLSTAGAATGSIVFRIKRRGATADQTKEYGLELWQ